MTRYNEERGHSWLDGLAETSCWRDSAEKHYGVGPMKRGEMWYDWDDAMSQLPTPPEGWSPRAGMPVVEKETIFFSLAGEGEKVFYVGSQEDFSRALETGKVPVMVDPSAVPVDWKLEVL
jgi:hypothetical protein